MDERRRTQRGRTYLGGQIAFNARLSMLDCVVKDLSAEGARVVVSSAAPVPTEFDFVIRQTGERHRARIVWRDQKHAGIAFLQAAAGAAGPAGAARHPGVPENRPRHAA